MVEALRITVMGTGLVFAAMALVLGAMLVLTLIRVSPKATGEIAPNAGKPQEAGQDERAARLRVAVIAAAIARARAHTPVAPASPAAAGSHAPSPWLAYHHARQLSSAPRRRM